MKNILLTGAGPNGFVGRNLRESLSGKYRILSPSSRELDLCDQVAVSEFVEKNDVAIVVHSAVHKTRALGAEGELENNLKMFFNLERLAGSLDKLLYFGSGAEYDKRFPVSMAREEEIGKSIPIDSYGLSKYIMNKCARNTANVVNLRLFGIFGKYEYWPMKFISNLCCKAIFDLPLTIRQNCLFDFLYIDDLAPIVEWFIGNRADHCDYNVCYGEPTDLLTIAHIVRDVSGKDLPIAVAKEGFNLEYTADNTRLKRQISGLRITDLRDAIGDLYRYYYDNRSSIDLATLRDTR